MKTMRRLKTLFVFTCVFLVAFIFPDQPGKADQTKAIGFNRDVRPIFSDTCYRCHGPDKNARKAGLRLDLREEATRKTKSGSTPIVPGKPELKLRS